MKKNVLLLSILLIMLVFNSCTPAYIPNVVNSPLFSEKKEFQANMNLGNNGIDPQFAYSLTDNLGFIANGSFFYFNDSSEFRLHYFMEGGIGYFNKFGKKGRIEIYGGYGYGAVEIDHTEFDLFSNERNYINCFYHRYFLQPGIGFSSNIYEFSFTPRFVMVNMNIVDYIGVNKPANNTYYPFFEPAITNKIGYKNVKFTLQTGFSIPMVVSAENLYEYKPFLLSAGICLKFNQKKKEKTE